MVSTKIRLMAAIDELAAQVNKVRRIAEKTPNVRTSIDFPDDPTERLALLKDMVAEAERTVISLALKKTGGSINAAAKLLQMPGSTLKYKVRDYGGKAALYKE
jgi:DNA-binding NtrC family response regulator